MSTTTVCDLWRPIRKFLATGLVAGCGLLPSLALAAPREEMHRSAQGLNAPLSIEQPARAGASPGLGLLLWFHADGGGSGYADIVRRLGATLAAEGWIMVAAKTPSGSTWHGDPNRHVAYAKDLLLALHKRFSPNKTVLAGASGGAVFITGQLLPAGVGPAAGGAVLLCGGAPSLLKGPSGAVFMGTHLASKFALHFHVQESDYIKPQVVQGVEYYRQLGFKVSTEMPRGHGHCGFDLDAALLGGMRQLGVR